MNISIFGLGYVGCVGMACLAEIGHSVVGVDVNKNKVDLINLGKSPIIEEQLIDMIQKQRGLGKIKATQDAITAIKETDVSFICVGTPSTTNGHLDLSVVLKVAEEIGRGLKEKKSFHIVVIRSTVLPGTLEKVLNILQRTSGKVVDLDFTVVSNPEFLREGTAIQDYYRPAFTLIGASNSEAVSAMREIYSKIEAPFIVTDVNVAELIKYVNNAFHALKITFGNEIGNICKKLRIDSHKVMDIFCMDTKLNLSPYYLKPGFAYGGSCLPKDLKALNTIAHDHYLRCPVLENIEVSNEFHKNLVLNEIIEFGKQKIGFLGLSFKAGTDDLRSSPIIDILEKLLGKGYQIKIYDHNIQLSQLIGSNREFIYQRIPFIARFMTEDMKEVIDQSEVIVVVNKEKRFKKIISDANHNKIIYDLVNVGLENGEKKGNYIGISW